MLDTDISLSIGGITGIGALIAYGIYLYVSNKANNHKDDDDDDWPSTGSSGPSGC